MIDKGRIMKFGCHLPLSSDVSVSGKLGLRHTAGLGLSEKSLSKEMARKLLKIETPEIDEQTKELMALFDQAMKASRVTQKGRPTKKQRRDLEKFKGTWR